MKNKMRLVIAVAAAAVCAWVWGTAAGPGAIEPKHTLQGVAAVEELKRTGTYESLRQAFEETTYSVEAAPGSGVWRARNRAQGLEVEFSPEEVALKHEQGELRLRLAGYGYGDRLHEPGPGELAGTGRRIENRRGGVSEWYVNEANGLEQGFTLWRRPAGAIPGEPLILALATEGSLRPEMEPGGQVVLLRGQEGVVLRYSGLKVWDARGKEMPSWMEVEAETIRLVVKEESAEYPLTVDPVFTQQAKLTATDGAASDRFGASVALSGDTAVIGADGKDFSLGAAYVFVRSGTTWTQQAKLIASDGAAYDHFGYSVALSGDTALIGAYGKDTSRGAAYVFVRSGSAWSQQAKLTASDGAADDLFGAAVALSGETALVGAPQDSIGPNSYQGSAYVFVRSGTIWSQQAKLTASDGAAVDLFGVSVALSGDTALIGASGDDIGANVDQGSAYVFVRSGTAWSQQAKLTAATGAANDAFGRSVALSQDTALVGADGEASARGSAYVFVRSGTAWSQQAKLTASDGAAGDSFGYSVALSGDVALVGAYGDDSVRGSAYVFVRSGTTWVQRDKLIPSTGAAYDYFGVSVALNMSTALVGSDSADVGFNADQGAAYVFAGAVNDEPADATVPSAAPYHATQDTRFATANATNDPVHSCTGSRDSNTVWFRYQAGFTGLLRVTTYGSDYDTVLTAYPGTTSPGTELACSDQAGGTPQSSIVFSVTAGQFYLIEVSGKTGGGMLSLHVMRGTPPTRLGVRDASSWIQDRNGNFLWDGTPTDRFTYWGSGQPNEVLVFGDWNGDGTTKIGVYRDGTWLLDYNGNGVWDGFDVDKVVYFGSAGFQPVVGDWNGSGTSKVGVYQNGLWIVDYNGNFAWDGTVTDRMVYFGSTGFLAVVGDWNGDGKSKMGVYKDGLWLLDYNGNYTWDGTGTDKLLYFGSAGQWPVVGDWTGTGSSKIGVHKDGLWVLDYNGNLAWDGTATDKLLYFGAVGYTGVVGDWNGDGRSKIGGFQDGLWVLDYNGNYTWDGTGTDKLIYFGAPGHIAAHGNW